MTGVSSSCSGFIFVKYLKHYYFYNDTWKHAHDYSNINELIEKSNKDCTIVDMCLCLACKLPNEKEHLRAR